MVLYLILTIIFTIIGITCLKKKFSLGIIPIIFNSCLLSGLITVIVATTTYYTNDRSKHELNNDTLISYSISKSLTPRGDTLIVIGGSVYSLNDFTGEPMINKRDTFAGIINVNQFDYCDVGLLWKVNNKKFLSRRLLLTKKQYGIYKAYKDTLEKRNQSLE